MPSRRPRRHPATAAAQGARNSRSAAATAGATAAAAAAAATVTAAAAAAAAATESAAVSSLDARLCAAVDAAQPFRFAERRSSDVLPPRVSNIVSCVRFGVRMTPHHIERYVPEAQYRPRRFHAVTARQGPPNSCMLLFESGKCVLNGVRTPHQVEMAFQNYASLLADMGHPVDMYTHEVNNAVLAAMVNGNLDLPGLLAEHRGATEYTNRFPAVVYRISEPRVKVTIFSSGKFNIVGWKTYDEAMRAWVIMFGILSKYVLPRSVKPPKLDKSHVRAPPPSASPSFKLARGPRGAARASAVGACDDTDADIDDISPEALQIAQREFLAASMSLAAERGGGGGGGTAATRAATSAATAVAAAQSAATATALAGADTDTPVLASAEHEAKDGLLKPVGFKRPRRGEAALRGPGAATSQAPSASSSAEVGARAQKRSRLFASGPDQGGAAPARKPAGGAAPLRTVPNFMPAASKRIASSVASRRAAAAATVHKAPAAASPRFKMALYTTRIALAAEEARRGAETPAAYAHLRDGEGGDEDSLDYWDDLDQEDGSAGGASRANGRQGMPKVRIV